MPRGPYPPGPKSRFPANLLRFRPPADPLAFLSSVAYKYGDIAHYRAGRQHVVLLSDPELIRVALVNEPHVFIKSRVMQRTKVLLGEGLLTSEGESHMRQRRLVQPAFHRQRIAAYAASMVELAALAGERWKDGATMDIHQEMMRLTLAIVGRTLFSVDIENEAADLGAAITALLDLFPFLVMPFSEWLERLPIGPPRKAALAVKRLDATIYRIIESRRTRKGIERDLLSMLLEARDAEAGEHVNDRQVRDECMTLFVAGHETTAVALTWTWYLLSQHPKIEARLHQEIDSVLGGRLPSFDDLPQLRYAEMVVAESMRLYPPAWTVARLALEPYHLREYMVPARTLLMMSQWVMHRHPRYFPDPERFDPERWTPEARASRPKFSYFPFGGGPRQCVGEGFAWAEVILLLVTLAQRWTMRLLPGHPVEPQPRLTLRPKYGMRMVLKKRHLEAESRPAAAARSLETAQRG
jgi:cytochrome P450